MIGSHQPLTGVAAPGYDEIAPASDAYFKYVNAHGGINGRKIIYKYLDDGYNPAKTVTVVHQLVLQDNVFAIFDGLGTPTHQAVVNFLNQRRCRTCSSPPGASAGTSRRRAVDVRLAAGLHP